MIGGGLVGGLSPRPRRSPTPPAEVVPFGTKLIAIGNPAYHARVERALEMIGQVVEE